MVAFMAVRCFSIRMSSPRLAKVPRDTASSNDAAILREAAERLTNPQLKAATVALVDGISDGGVVVAKLTAMLSPQGAAEMIGVSRQYIDKMIYEGRLPCTYKPGSSHKLLATSDVVEFEKERANAGRRVGAAINDVITAGADY